MKKAFFAFAAFALLVASLAMPLAPQADAQSFKLEEVTISCNDGQCFTTGCQLSTVQNCSGFQQCPC